MSDANQHAKFFRRTSTGTVLSGNGMIAGFQLNGAGDSTVVLRDGGAGGTIIGQAQVSTIHADVSFPEDHHPEFKTDLHATLSGVGATLEVWIS